MTGISRNASLWSAEAANWISWARRPGHDAYWHYRDSFLALVGSAVGMTLDVGCGEGRVARDLAERGHDVVAIDRSIDLVTAAAHVDPHSKYVVADAAALPFRFGAFATVAAHNVLMDVDDLTGTVDEVARVMSPGGRLVASVLHPLATAGDVADDTPNAEFTVRTSYFERRLITKHVQRDGLKVRLSSFHRTLEDYVVAVRSCGLELTELTEPRPAAREGPIRSQSARRGDRIPMVLQFSATKGSTDASTSLDALLTDWCTWFATAMPDATPHSFLLKVAEEADEFLTAPSLEELSDTLVTLIGWLRVSGYNFADLAAASREKLARNRQSWVQLADGRYKHIDEPGAQPD